MISIRKLIKIKLNNYKCHNFNKNYLISHYINKEIIIFHRMCLKTSQLQVYKHFKLIKLINKVFLNNNKTSKGQCFKTLFKIQFPRL